MNAMAAPLALVIAMLPCHALADGIALRGTAEMGLIGTADPARSRNDVRLYSALDLHLRFSRTTDGGLTFAIEVDLDAPDGPGRSDGFPP